MSDTTALEHGQAIAIVGMSGRFPGAASVREFWQNLCGGVESVVFIPREELIKAGYPEAVVRDPAYVPAKAVLDGIDLFDAGFKANLRNLALLERHVEGPTASRRASRQFVAVLALLLVLLLVGAATLAVFLVQLLLSRPVL